VNLNVGGATYVLNGVVASGGQGFVANLYGTPGSGTLKLQTSKAAPSGGYAFSLYGGDQYAQTAAIGGVLNIDSAGGISGNGSVLDIEDGVNATGEVTLGASTVSAPDQFGEVQIQLTPSSLVQPLYLAGYIIDATHIRLIETGGDRFLGVLGGTALGQGSKAGHFDSSSLAGSNYVFGFSGFDQQGALQVAGLLTAGASGGVSGVLSWNDLSGKQPQTPVAFTGTYAVDSTGRVTLSNLTDGANFNYSLHMYLSGNGEALMVASDNTRGLGEAFEQQTGAFSAASLSGRYGLNASQFSSATSLESGLLASIDSVASGGTDAWTGFADVNGKAADTAVSGEFTAGSNGVFSGTVTGLDATPSTPGDFTLYMIDSTRGVAIETDNDELTLGYMELAQ
jgi:hypothetical protein